MDDLNTLQRLGVFLLVGLYVLTCVRVALGARRVGRNPVLWFFITLALTAVPACILFARDRNRQSRESTGSAERGRDGLTPRAPVRCLQCGALIDPHEWEGATPALCPRCKLPFDKVHLA